jgi:intracellular septation protein
MSPKAKIWIRGCVDYGGGVAFVLANLITGNAFVVSGVVVGVSLIALAVGFGVERRLAPIPLATAIIGVVFGGLTLIFHAAWILQVKLTILETAFGLFLLTGLIRGTNPLKTLMGEAFHLPDPVVRTLTLRYALMFFAIAIANEVVRHTQSFRVWGLFKLPGVPIIIFLFAMSQAPLMMKHMPDDEAETPPGGDKPPADAS